MQQSVTTSSVSLPGTTALTKAVRPLPSAADTAAVEMCTSDNSAPGWEGQVVLMPHAPSQPARRVIGGLRAQCVQASNVNLKLELTDERLNPPTIESLVCIHRARRPVAQAMEATAKAHLQSLEAGFQSFRGVLQAPTQEQLSSFRSACIAAML